MVWSLVGIKEEQKDREVGKLEKSKSSPKFSYYYTNVGL